MAQPLSVALRSRTSTAHERAEGSEFIESLIGGRACRAAFVALAAQQLVIYRALEDVLWGDYADHPLLAPVMDHRLDRVGALEADLTHLVGPDADVRMATGAIRIQEATRVYATTLRTRHTPEMMLAHHYVRYLGDLSGGQVIARMMQRHYGVGEQGLGFYRFTGIPKAKPYKDAYRAHLDGLDTTPRTRERILGEAEQAFEMNRLVFADLAAARAPEHAAAGGPS